ncbi:MAG: type II toxin-antitoxin system RelE/ParE family toxin [Terriglobales bacterium]
MPSSAAEFHPEAAAEYDAAFDWYRARSPDAALRFDFEVERAVAQIVASPHRRPLGPYGTRKFLLSRFPFVLFYRERGIEGIQIVAVAHTSRRPGYWKQRV